MDGPTPLKSPAVSSLLDLSDVQAIPLDKVEFSRPVEVTPGVFCQVLRFGQKLRTPGEFKAGIDVFAWLDGSCVVLSTGQTIPLSGGLVQLYVPGE